MEYDEILSVWGGFGLYDVSITIILSIQLAFTSALNMASNFYSPNQQHWCDIPYDVFNVSEEELKRQLIPYDEEEERYASCVMYDVPYDVIQNVTDANLTSCYNGYEYDRSTYQVTATSEWDLVCDREWILEIISPLFMVGFLLGSMFSGSISNRLGRKKSMVLYSVLVMVFSLAGAFSPNPAVFITLRVVVAFFSIACAMSDFCLLSELCPPRHRIAAASFQQSFYALGVIALATAAYFIRHFRVLTVVLALLGLPLISAYWVLPESPRWLMSKGRYADAAREISKMFRLNRRHLPTEIIEEHIVKKTGAVECGSQSKPETSPYRQLLSSWTAIKYLLVISFIWSSVNFTYFAVSLNLGELFGDIHVNMALAGIIEIVTIYLTGTIIHRVGRKPPLYAHLIIMSICGVISTVFTILDVADIVPTICSLITRSSAGCGIMSSILLVAEVFPTSIRQSAMGLANTGVYAVAIVSPFIGGPVVLEIWRPLPTVLYTALSIVAILLLPILPETHNKKLPDTLAEMKNIANAPTLPRSSGHKHSNMKQDWSSKGQQNDAFIGDCGSSYVPDAGIMDTLGEMTAPWGRPPCYTSTAPPLSDQLEAGSLAWSTTYSHLADVHQTSYLPDDPFPYDVKNHDGDVMKNAPVNTCSPIGTDTASIHTTFVIRL